jgi:hypothetical protein
MNARRLTLNSAGPPRLFQRRQHRQIQASAGGLRTPSLPRVGWQVLCADLNCSESRGALCMSESPAGARLNFAMRGECAQFFHSDRVQTFNFKWIKTGFGYPRPAFICECGRPTIKLYFRHLNLGCRNCCNTVYSSQVLGKRTRPILQTQRLQTFLSLKSCMWKSNAPTPQSAYRSSTTARTQQQTPRSPPHTNPT